MSDKLLLITILNILVLNWHLLPVSIGAVTDHTQISPESCIHSQCFCIPIHTPKNNTLPISLRITYSRDVWDPLPLCCCAQGATWHRINIWIIGGGQRLISIHIDASPVDITSSSVESHVCGTCLARCLSVGTPNIPSWARCWWTSIGNFALVGAH